MEVNLNRLTRWVNMPPPTQIEPLGWAAKLYPGSHLCWVGFLYLLKMFMG